MDVDSHQPCEFCENWLKTATCIMAVIIIISWKPKSVIFECKLKNIYKVLLVKSILIRKKISWRINFILLKFFLNKLLLEKLRNECKKHHSSIRLCVSSWTSTMEVQCCLSTFMAWNCWRLWFISTVMRCLNTSIVASPCAKTQSFK